ncbi:MAG: hypothetical protein U0T84_02465 [Chitinophagales bacterium]
MRKAIGAPRPTADSLIRENNRQRIYESRGADTDSYDIFLSHSSKDAQVILGILVSLNELGYKVYVDWVDDPQLDRSSVTKATANTLRTRMIQSKSLLYATTQNASSSKWMPWELGYMDGKKDRAAILPVFETESSSSLTYKGQEYLGIYPYCIKTGTKLNPKKEVLWIFENPDTYVTFDGWIDGEKPKKQN